ncbi:hypothetical protein WAB17_08975 [Parerythrobacter aurantius]|uniref:hypothetical protein n=1 Tax=Parerythrobacter aurantius TaxID=3127706 RepID=UPI0032486BD6
MRLALTLLSPVLALGACKAEPSFEERYDATSKKIGEQAEQLDEELERPTATEAAEKQPRP